MIIKDPVTCESLVRDNYKRMPDDGYDYTNCHIYRLREAAQVCRKAPYEPAPAPKKQEVMK